MKYSKRFEEDFDLYWRLQHTFTFAPHDPLKAKKPIDITADMPVKKAFYNFDTHGKYYNIANNSELLRVITTKASINFHIKLWAESRALGEFGSLELLESLESYNFPQWVFDAIEEQKKRLWRKYPANYPNPLELANPTTHGSPSWLVKT